MQTYRERKNGQTIALVVDGKRYELAPVDVISDFDLATQYYKLLQRPPVEAISEAAEELAKNPAVSERMMSRLFDALRSQGTVLAVPSKTVVSEWLDTVDGLAFSLHLQLSRNHPDEFPDPREPGFDLAKLDFRRAREIVAKIGREYARLRDESSPEAVAIADAAAAQTAAAAATTSPAHTVSRPSPDQSSVRPIPAGQSPPTRAVVEGPTPSVPAQPRRSFAAARGEG